MEGRSDGVREQVVMGGYGVRKQVVMVRKQVVMV